MKKGVDHPPEQESETVPGPVTCNTEVVMIVAVTGALVGRPAPVQGLRSRQLVGEQTDIVLHQSGLYLPPQLFQDRMADEREPTVGVELFIFDSERLLLENYYD